MTTKMNVYLANAERFSAVVTATDGGSWDAQSPCEDWLARDLVDHVVDTQRDFLGKRGADIGDRPGGDPAQVWTTHLDGVRRVGADEDFVTAKFDGYFGETTVADMMADFYGFDMLVHRWDVGTALGQEVTFDHAELALIQANLDNLGDQLYTEGVCKPAVEVPGDASRQTRLLGRLGRRSRTP